MKPEHGNAHKPWWIHDDDDDHDDDNDDDNDMILLYETLIDSILLTIKPRIHCSIVN